MDRASIAFGKGRGDGAQRRLLASGKDWWLDLRLVSRGPSSNLTASLKGFFLR